MPLGNNMVIYEVLDNPKKIYSKMIRDIKNAKKEILLETYIYGNDSIGKVFHEELTKKASKGINVNILVDSFGSKVKKKFFKKLIDAGGRVRFFKELRYVFRFFSANHERNHRKLLVIDNKISYIGSINITSDCLEWNELVIRFDNQITSSFRRSFFRSWKRFNLFNIRSMKKIIHKSFEILHDFPSNKDGSTEKNYRSLIKNSKKEVLIITPYFVPSMRMRKTFTKAIKRGVKIILILPFYSDVKALDIFRNRYLGKLHKVGVKIYYYPKILHSKLLVVDKKIFLLGSSNLDYRSFMHQFEINILGRDPRLVKSLKDHFYSTLEKSRPFNYNSWLERHFLTRWIDKIVNWFLKYYERYL